MTNLEKMINAVCHDPHTGDQTYEEFEYDLRDGHYHVTPEPPDSLGEVTYSHNPAEVYADQDLCFSIEDLIELRNWLNIVLEESP